MLGAARPAVVLLAACSAAHAAVQIPFELTGHHTFVEVELNGRTLSFVFDTGAGGVALNEVTARRLGLEASGSAPAIGAAGSMQVPLVRGLTLRLGGLRIDGVAAGLVAVGHLEERVGRPLDGIIGRDVLNGRLVLLDYDRLVLEVHDRRSFPFEDWGEPCAVSGFGPLQVDGGIRLLSGDGLRGKLHFDSGAAAFVSLSSPFVRRHGLDERVGPTAPRKGRGLTGVVTEDRIGRIAAVTLCGHQFPSAETRRVSGNVPVALSGATTGVQASNGPAGLIGNAILARFNAVFDLARRRIYLKPNSRWNDPILTDASGLRLVRRPDGAILIDEVVTLSPAADAGLARGDRIRSIDDTTVETLTLADLRDRLKHPGRTFSLVVARDGESRRVVLESRALGGL